MTPSELLPVVDEHDRLIDTRRRAEIHSRGLRHRAVHILVFNDQQQLFLQKRSLNKDINPGLWDSSAAGHVDAGESYDHCAARELTEELGITVASPPALLFKIPASEVTGMEFVQVYHWSHNGPFRLSAEEIDQGDWFSTQAIDQRVADDDGLLTDTFKTLWRIYRSKIRPVP